jgi:hypothetical protein
MTEEKIIDVVQLYRKLLNELGYIAKQYPENAIVNSKRNKLEHCLYMLDNVAMFVSEKRLEKAFRWLGFIQGILWSEGLFKLDDLKNHNMPV